MRAFKPEEILKNNQASDNKYNNFFNSNGSKKFLLLAASFVIVLVFLSNFINLSAEGHKNIKTVNVKSASVPQKVYAAAILVNGQQKVIVKDEAGAQALLKELINTNLPNGKLEIKRTYFKEKVTTEKVLAEKTAILDNGKALNLLLYGNASVQKYVAKKGDNLWLIARRNNMHQKDILAANPGLDEEKLAIGQVIFLKKPLPMVTVVAVLEGKSKREIPYDTKITKDKDLRRGEEKVVTEGKNGTRIFKYEITAVNGIVTDKKVLEDYIAEKPVTKVIASGSARRTELLASRSDGGRRGFIWPKHGNINSPYGYRGGEFHTGIDISGSTGDAVVAAASGTVVSAGWGGGYGKNIVIDHGNGIMTRYAHLSSINVSEGETVSRGDYIGAVGSTGRATGPHLHFEIIVNGETRNPLNYLD